MALNTGVTALARELGVSHASISVRMSKGQTEDYIRRAVRQKRGLIDKIAESKSRKAEARGEAKAGSGSGSESRSYTPGRKPVQSVPISVKPQPSKIVKPGNGDGNGNEGNGNGHGGSYEQEEVGRAEWNGENIIQAELRRTIAQANEREVKVAQLKRELVPVAQVNFWFGQRIVKARDILMRIGPELRDRLAIADDPIQCEKMITDEVVRALNELALMPIEGDVPTVPGSGAGSGADEDEN